MSGSKPFFKIHFVMMLVVSDVQCFSKSFVKTNHSKNMNVVNQAASEWIGWEVHLAEPKMGLAWGVARGPLEGPVKNKHLREENQ